MSDLLADPSLPPALSAYELLSKPTLQLTDAEVEVIVTDLRRRRETHMLTGKPDKPRAAAKAKADPLSKEAKKAASEALLAQLVLPTTLAPKA